jgi:hypothetical protein
MTTMTTTSSLAPRLLSHRRRLTPTVKPTPRSVQLPKLMLLAVKVAIRIRTRRAGLVAGSVARRTKCLVPGLLLGPSELSSASKVLSTLTRT